LVQVQELPGANLRDANLRGADLNEANLRGAYLSGAYLSIAILEGAAYNKETVWPTGFDPEAEGAVFVDE
jgi:uncharacterized protein YjbI with pentapeptide repeats